MTAPVATRRPRQAADAVRTRVGRNVQVLLKARGTGAKDLAHFMGWNESMLYRRLSGQTTITIDELDSFADFLDVEPGVFFLATEDLIRSRYIALSQVPALPGQMELALGASPALVAVG